MNRNESTDNLLETGGMASYGSVQDSRQPSLNDERLSEPVQAGKNVEDGAGWKSFVGIFLTLMTSAQMAMCLLIAKLLSNYHPFMLGFWEFSGNLFIIPILLYHQCYQKEPVFSEINPKHSRRNKLNLVLLLLLCFGWSVATTLEFYAIRYITLADVSTIVYSTPVFVTIVSHVVLGEGFGIVPLFCSLLTLLGVIVVTRPPILTGAEFNTDTLIGCGMAAGSLLIGVFAYITLRHLRNVHYTVTPLFLGLWGILQSAISAAAISKFEFPQDRHDWLLVCGHMFFSFTPLLCLTLAFKYETAGTVSLFRTFDIIFAFIWQYLFLGVVPDWISLLGGVIVILGVATASLRKIVSDLPPEHPLNVRLAFILK